jgi:transcriptional regulator with XRE-family HTH domain
MDGWELREQRRAQGLTLREVARAAGTDETNLSAYERGAKVPNRRTLTRVLASIAAGANSPVHTRHLLTAPAAAAALRKGLREGWRTSELLRLIREMRSNAKFVGNAADREAFYAEPSTTGDQRWDAMLAGSVEDLALRDGQSVPEWTRGGPLPQFWFVSSMPSLRAYAFAHSPFSLQVRGVMVDPADLESV